MKSIGSILASVLWILIPLAFVACQQKTGLESSQPGKTPPVPEKGTLELAVPASTPEAVPAPINEQDESRFQYSLRTGDKRISGNFSAKGAVLKVEARQIEVKLEDGSNLILDYKLPAKESKLIANTGEELTVEQYENLDGPGMNRLFSLHSAKSTLVSSGRQSSGTPVEVKISGNITLRQAVYSENKVLVESERDIHYDVPLAVLAGGRQLKIPQDGKAFVFADGSYQYDLHLVANGFNIAKKGHEDAFEGQGYYLDYWLLRTK